MFFTKKYKKLIKNNNDLLKENNKLLRELIAHTYNTRQVGAEVEKEINEEEINPNEHGKIDYKEYWSNDDLKNIIPLNHGEYPEGFDVRVFLAEITKELEFDSVLDFGCGYGRLSKAFDLKKYTGIDLNPNALNAARERNPGYRYQETFVDVESYPVAQLGLAYTVFLHLDEITLQEILSKLLKNIGRYFIISEILGREWRRSGLPPVFCREKKEYVNLMEQNGFELVNEYSKPYKRYAENASFVGMRNTDISFLIFERKLKV